MRFLPSAAALALLLLASYSSAATPLQAFLASSFEPGSAAQASALLVNGSFYLVYAGGNETYVLDASNGKAVEGIGALTALLEQDARNRASYEQKMSSAMSFAASVSAAKNASEAKCLQYIGDDGDPGCTDRQTCIVSCYSSPQCSLIIQADGFIGSVMEWDAARRDFSAALDAYSGGLDAMRNDPQAIEGKMSILSNLSSLAANMSQNGIFLTRADGGCSGANATRKCFEYCPKIDYSAQRIQAQSQELAGMKAALSDVASQRSRAEAIVNRSLENDAYLSSRGRVYGEFSARMLNGIRGLRARGAELARNVSDPKIAPMILQLENISRIAKNRSESGYYRDALALRAPFEALSNATSSAIGADNASYSSLENAMKGFSDKASGSAWLIGNASADAHLGQLASLEANYSAPLSLSEISAAGAALSEMGSGLDAEISSKAAKAGNSTSPPPAPGKQPSLPCLPALIFPPALLFAFARARRRL